MCRTFDVFLYRSRSKPVLQSQEVTIYREQTEVSFHGDNVNESKIYILVEGPSDRLKVYAQESASYGTRERKA